MRGDGHRKRQSPFPSYWYCLNKKTTTKTSGWKASSTPEHCAHRLVREKSLPELCHISVCHIPWSGFYWFIGLDLTCGKTDSPLTTHKSPPLWSWNRTNVLCHLPPPPPPPPAAAKKLTEESVPPHAAPTIRVLTGVCVRSDYTLAMTNTSTLSYHRELNLYSADKDLERVHTMVPSPCKTLGQLLKSLPCPATRQFHLWVLIQKKGV